MLDHKNRAQTILDPRSRTSTSIDQSSTAAGTPPSPAASGISPIRQHLAAGPARQTGQVRYQPISRRQAIHIASQLSVMIDTGIPLPEALETLADQSNKPHLCSALADIYQKVRAGTDISLAVANCP